MTELNSLKYQIRLDPRRSCSTSLMFRYIIIILQREIYSDVAQRQHTFDYHSIPKQYEDITTGFLS